MPCYSIFTIVRMYSKKTIHLTCYIVCHLSFEITPLVGLEKDKGVCCQTSWPASNPGDSNVGSRELTQRAVL